MTDGDDNVGSLGIVGFVDVLSLVLSLILSLILSFVLVFPLTSFYKLFS